MSTLVDPFRYFPFDSSRRIHYIQRTGWVRKGLHKAVKNRRSHGYDEQPLLRAGAQHHCPLGYVCASRDEPEFL